ncbi:histone H1.8 [Catharus ustulatus]|uniref:histone H1.8 n=1 Tax=Catharus ustulatus TaxID=91951 RepID=UPI001C5ABE88|nr:histone H1.8 [Catharus ustulatus]
MIPLLAAKASGVARRGQAQHPPTLQMVKEALRAHDEKKGASVVAIKRFILAKYPSVDPIRLKYLLKQALSKGLSCGELVRPQNSSAVGATGTFKLAHKKQLGQADAESGQAGKPGQKGAAKAAQAPVAGAQQQGATKQQPAATKQPKAKPVKAKPPAAQKPRSDKAKHPQAAEQPQARGTGPAGAPKAASHHQAPRKGRSKPSTALAAESTGDSDSDSSDSSASAGVKGPQKPPRGKSKGKVPKGAQQNAPKAQRGQDQAKKPRVMPGARQGKKARPKKAAPVAADKKAP